MYKVSKKEFEQFKKECDKWIKFWGLTEWRVTYVHVKINEDTYARAIWDIGSMAVTIQLNKEFDEYKNAFNLKKTAFHEVCELLLAKLERLMNNRFITERQIDSEIHHVIRRLENCVYGKM